LRDHTVRWSKLKQLVEARMADSLDGRVELHVARYTQAHDGDGRAWITIDKREIVNFCDYAWMNQRWSRREEYAEVSASGSSADAMARRSLADEGVFSHYLFVRALEDYLNMSIDDAIASQNGIIRAFGFLDQRCGKRRLRLIELEPSTPAFVRELLDLRRAVEGIIPRPPLPTAVSALAG
jgi:hypothetical protein